MSTGAPQNRRFFARSISLVVASLYGQFSYSQEFFPIEEIIVTARKWTEKLQDTPVTVNAFDKQTIEDAGIESMSDYIGLVSNVSLIETQNSAFTFVNIRGNSQVRNADPSVAIVVDGVLSTSPLSFSQEMFDVQQIEVLKGPQGALYGRNAVGGAINITTKQPSNEAEAMVRIGYGNGDSWKAQGAVSGPVVEDTLLYRVAVSFKDSDGLRENTFLKKSADPYKSEAIQAKLVWIPDDGLSVDFRFSYSDNEGAGQQFAVNAPLWQASYAGSPFPPNLQITGGDIEFAVPGNTLAGDPNNTSTDIQGNILGVDDRETYNTSVKFDWKNEFCTITITSAYDLVDHFQGGEQFPYTSAAVQKSSQYRRSESVSQEFRITSPENERLRWITGIYYVQTEFFFSVNLQEDNDSRNLDRVTKHPVQGGINPTVPFGFSADVNDNEAYAVFAQLNYDATDELEVSFALRNDRDKRQQTVKTPTGMIPDFFTFSTGDKRSESFDALQPKLSLRYQPTGDLTVYTIYSQGFRSGGFNASGISNRAAELRATDPTVPAGIQDTYEQEDSEGFELGFKSILMDGHLKVSGAAYITNVDNQPLFNFVAPLNNAQIIRSIDEVQLKGFELEAQFSINERLRVWGSYGYTDAEIQKFGAEPFNEGNSSPYTPEDSINLGIQYRHPIHLGGVLMEGMIRLDWSRTGDTYFSASNFKARDHIDLLNLRVGVDIGEAWNLAAWAKNLTDEDYVAEQVNPPGVAYYAKPRSYGMELTRRF